MLPFDPMGYAPNYSWVISGNGTAVSKYGMTTAFDNIIKYQGEFSGTKVGASYGFGEVAGSTGDSRKFAVGLGYAAGPFSVGATYDQVNGNTVVASGGRNEATTFHLGAAYKLSKNVALKGGYRNYKLDPAAAATADVRADTYWRRELPGDADIGTHRRHLPSKRQERGGWHGCRPDHIRIPGQVRPASRTSDSERL